MSHQNSSPDQNISTNEMPGVRINNLVQGMFRTETVKILEYGYKVDSGVEGVMINAMEGLFRVGVNFNHSQFITAGKDQEIPGSPVVSNLIEGTTTHVASHFGRVSNDDQSELAA